MKAFDYIKSLEHLPCSKEGSKIGKASNSEIKRWLEKSSININNEHPKPDDEIELPVKKLIFFEKGVHKTTMVYDDFVWLQDYANMLVKNFHTDWRKVE